MSGLALFVCSVAVYAGLPLLFALRRTPFQFLLLYTHIAAVLTLGGLLGAVYVLPLFGDVSLLAGQVAYGGFMFSTLLTVIVGRDLHVVRNVVVLTVAVDALVYLVFVISHAALGRSSIPNPLSTSPAVFDESLRVVVAGGVLIILELLALIGLLELAKVRLSRVPMAAVYVLAFIGILTLDGVLFPTLVLVPPNGLGALIAAGVQAKLVLAGAFSLPLLLFVSVYRGPVTRFESTPLHLPHLISLSRDPLLDRLDATTEQVGRTAAVVGRLLDAATKTAMVATDLELTITHVNRGATELLNLTREQLIGQKPQLFHDREALLRQAADLGVQPDPVAVVQACVREGGRRPFHITTGDGTVRVLSLSMAEIRDPDGTHIGYLTSGEDVTEQLRAEAAMADALHHEREAVARLEAADRVKDELVSTISHELRTPITSIHGYSELLSDGSLGDLNGEQSDALGKVLRNTSRLEVLVEDLLFVAKAEAGKLTLRLEPVDVRRVVELSREVLEQMCRDRDLEVRYDLPDEEVPVVGDPHALERIVTNLAGNAIKFTPDGGTVTILVRREEGGATLTITDTGIGIGEDDRSRLFQRFFRAAEANRLAIPGSGLGLSVVQGIVARHGGTIGVESALGRGTRIDVHLPSARTAPGSATAPSRQA